MDPSPAVTANLPRLAWDRSSRGGYEVWYGKVVGIGAACDSALWFRYTVECDGPDAAPVGHCWGVFFQPGTPPLVLIQPFEPPSLDPGSAEFHVELSPEHKLGFERERGSFRAVGAVAVGRDRVDWDLSWSPAAPPFRYLSSERLRRLVSSSGACTPCPHARMEGTVAVTRGESPPHQLTVNGPGMQGHLWGAKKAHSWSWAHCNAFLDAGSGAPADVALEVLRVQRRRGARPLTTMYLWVDGVAFPFNRPGDLIAHRRWLLAGAEIGNKSQQDGDRLLVERPRGGGAPGLRGHFELLPESTAEVEYRDTDGSLLMNRNGTMARAEIELLTDAGPRRLVAARSATLEVVTRP